MGASVGCSVGGSVGSTVGSSCLLYTSQVVAFDAWKTLGEINGKFYSSSTADKAAWVDYTPDAKPATYTAVSYTHLDVYKRQPMSRLKWR